MNRTRILTLAATLLLLPAVAQATKCLDDPGDAAQIGAARAAVDAACKCFSFNVHDKYVACGAGVVRAQADASLLRQECRRTVKKIYAESVCGKPVAARTGPAVPFVSKRASDGKVGCTIKPAGNRYFSPRGTARQPCFASTTCLDAADTNGDLKIGAPGDSGECAPSSSSFSDHGDGTITDNATGLMWEKLSDDGSIHDWHNAYSWADAAAVKVAALNGGGGFAGHTDWRVPTISELQTLIREGPGPVVDAAFNTGCAPGCTVLTCSCTVSSSYWSSSPYFPAHAWYVRFSNGYVDSDSEGFHYYVRAVRGGS